MSIEKFIAGLNALSKETGIYLRGSFHYEQFDEKLHEQAEAITYSHSTRIENYDGAGNGATGEFLSASGLKHLPVMAEPQEFGRAPMGISDLEPYMSATGEHIGGRRQHREFLKANNLMEVGNEKKAFENAVRQAQAPQRITKEEVAREFAKAEAQGSRH